MYKNIFFTIMMLCVGVGFANAQTSRVPYAVLDEGTLTFYDDWDMSNRQGTKFEIDATNPEPVWMTNESVSSITKVKFDGSFYNFLPKSTAWWFSELTNLTEVEDLWYLNTTETENMSYMFMGCKNLKSLYVGALFTSAVKNVGSMFNRCSSLETLDGINANTVDVSNVVNMSNMFASCTSLKSLNLEKFQTSNVVYMANMFSRCQSLEELNIPNFDTGNVTDMSCMFQLCSSLTSLDLSHFNTAHVTNMSYMFYGCENLRSLNLNGFDTSLVRNMSNMFYDCSSLTSIDLSRFNTSNVTNMSYMFSGCSSLTSLNLSTFNTAQVTNISSMFCDCKSLTSLNLSTFNTAQVTDMGKTFRGCENLGTIVVGKSWNTSNVTSSDYMFYDCKNLVGGAGTTYDADVFDKTYAHVDEGTENPGYLSYEAYAVYNDDDHTLTFWYNDQKAIWPETNVYEISEESPAWYGLPITRVTFTPSFANTRPKSNFHWFFELSGLTEIVGIENLNTSCSTNMSGMFRGCSSLTTLDLSNFDTSSVTDMSSMFNGCSNLTSLDLSNFDTSNVTDMIYMFYGCSSLTSLDLSSFITGNVTSMFGMFSECTSLTSLKMNFSTDNVENMSLMFFDCKSLTSLDLSSFNTSKVTDMMSMFDRCEKLGIIVVGVSNDDVTLWDTSSVTSSDNMFYHCTALKGYQGTAYSEDHTDVEYARIDGGTSNPGYLSVISYGISVNGKIVDIVNKNDVLGDGTVTFDGAGTLTLNGAQLTSMSVTGTATTADDGWVHIVVKGECKVAGSSLQVVALHKKTIIEGTGKLIVNQTGTNPGAGIRLMSEEADLTVKDIELGIAAGLHGILGYNKGLSSRPNYVNTITFDNANCHINIIGNVLDSANPGCIIGAEAIKLIDCTMKTGSVIQSKTSGYCVPEKKMVIERDESPIVTAIEGMEAVQTFDASAPLYNLQGQRVSHPMKGHIYTQKGRKYRF